jgi:hypothetical protein
MGESLNVLNSSSFPLFSDFVMRASVICSFDPLNRDPSVKIDLKQLSERAMDSFIQLDIFNRSEDQRKGNSDITD